MDISIQTSIGKTRPDNQDFSAYFTDQNNNYLAVICDGMGGHKGGDIASEMAVNHLGHAFQESEMTSAADVMAWLDEQIQLENDRIYQASMRFADLKGMGTTIVVVVFLNQQYIVAHVGDSRAYLFQEGQLKLLTEDDSFVNQLILNGELTPEEGLHHPKRNVLTQSLGVEERLNVHSSLHSYKKGDIILLASDGLYDGLSLSDMEYCLSEWQSSQDIAYQLHDLSLQQSGQDNLTVLVAQPAEGEVEG